MTMTLDDELADLRRANAELRRRLDERTREHDEALQRETATAEVLQVINSSPGDLGPVFDAILDKAMRLCDAAHGHIWIFDGERALPIAFRGDPQTVEWMQQFGPVQPGPTPMGRVVRGEQVVHIADARQDDAYPSYLPFRSQVDACGIRTILDIALRKDGTLLGIIAVYRQDVRLFSDKQIALLQNFAAQAVIAMENARLITETREALEQQTATAEVLQVINASPGDLGPVFDAMLEKAMKLCGAAFGFMTVIDGEQTRTVAARGVPEAYAAFRERNPTPANSPIASRVRKGERFIHIVDLKAERFYGEGDPQRRAIVDLGGARTLLAAPLMRDQAVLGAIQVYCTEVRPFSEKQIALLQNFAAQAVIAMENARLITETREALEQQTATAEILQVINSSPGDLAPVFDAMLEKATRFCEGTQGILWTYDGERFRSVAMYGVAAEFAAFLEQGVRPGPRAPIMRILRGERLVEIIDLAADQSYQAGEPLPRAAVEMGGFRSMIFVALVKDETLLGAFAIARQEVRAFTEKQIALAGKFRSAGGHRDGERAAAG